MQAHVGSLTTYNNARKFVTDVANTFRAMTTPYEAEHVAMIQFAMETAQQYDLWEERDALAKLITPQRDAGLLLTTGYGKRMARQSITALFGGM